MCRRECTYENHTSRCSYFGALSQNALLAIFEEKALFIWKYLNKSSYEINPYRQRRIRNIPSPIIPHTGTRVIPGRNMVPYRLKVNQDGSTVDAFVLIVLDDIAVISFEIRYVNQKNMYY